MAKSKIRKNRESMKIKRILDIIVHPIKVKKECQLIKSYGKIGNNSHIYNPYVVSHPQNVFVGDNTTILDNVEIRMYPERTGHSSVVEIGNHCYAREDLTLLGAGDIIIGDGCVIAKGVSILSHNHGMDPESKEYYSDQLLLWYRTEIGEGCWIGERAIVLPGKKIGKKCIIGAGAVVSHNIPDYSIAVGNPAKVIKTWSFTEHKWVKCSD